MSTDTKVAVKTPVCLIAIDGWGINKETKGNAVANAKTPCMSSFDNKKYLTMEIDAHGNAVGLPKGVMGNSEVGHLTMGAGRVQYQDLARINKALDEKAFLKQPALREALEKAAKGPGRVHFLGLVSDGGVHSHIEQLFGFFEAAKEMKVPNAYLHFFGDGRDTAPSSAAGFLTQCLDFFKKGSYGKLATVIGRYYAMDRDNRWDRISIAYEAMLAGKGEATSPDKVLDLIKAKYAAGENDEFFKPMIVDAEGVIRDGDVVVFMNFRSDRMRELVMAIAMTQKFPTTTVRKDLHILQCTQYNAEYKFPIMFPPQSMENVLAEWLSKQGVRQFHTAETEKYAHVTFFFNGGKETPFPLEDRALVASPKCATYDLEPKMSAAQVADIVVEAIGKGVYPFVMCNFAPPDMVGHTGMYDKTIEAVEHTDACVARILEACQKHGYALAITADHGNAEEMLDEQGNVKTSHTTNPIPFNIAGPPKLNLKWTGAAGGLSDVAPTILNIMGLPIPVEMEGRSLLAPVHGDSK